MTVLLVIVLAAAVIAALIGALAFHRLATSLERLHAGAFVTAVAGAAIVVAAFLTDGVGGRPIKVLLLYLLMLVGGALANHAVARAIHLRSGQRR